MTLIRVFESGSGKWVSVKDGDILYTSDIALAEVFDIVLLRSADMAFGDFSIYKRTLHAVPQGTNHLPCECKTVKEYIKQEELKK